MSRLLATILFVQCPFRAKPIRQPLRRQPNGFPSADQGKNQTRDMAEGPIKVRTGTVEARIINNPGRDSWPPAPGSPALEPQRQLPSSLPGSALCESQVGDIIENVLDSGCPIHSWR